MAFGLLYWLTLEPYWEQRKGIFDSTRNEYRCVDENGELSALRPPCAVLTLRGLRTLDERAAACRRRGGVPAVCHDEAWSWMYAQRPTR